MCIIIRLYIIFLLSKIDNDAVITSTLFLIIKVTYLKFKDHYTVNRENN